MGNEDKNDKKYKLDFKGGQNSVGAKKHYIFNEIGQLIMDVMSGKYSNPNDTIVNYRGWKKFTDLLIDYIEDIPPAKKYHFPDDLKLEQANEFNREFRSNLNTFYGLIMPDFIVPELLLTYNKTQIASVTFSYFANESETYFYNYRNRSLFKKEDGQLSEPLPDNRWA
ncbi:MAG: hypothetical protein JXR70_09380 [Spirochaetales bacterium]|nr:hypothetical protein [Spirochaetales bacterium]